ncbi:MAG: flagellar basal-body MS-ring/collar protein FliF [Spirochaetes bacterium]|nr:flagellar basal-body MS-ring/collar protein FliF [Spirochaetota bacterium]
MNPWLTQILERITTVWKKWTVTQKLIFIGVLVGVIGGVVLLAALSSAPSMVPLLYRSIPNEQEMARITQRLDQEGVRYELTSDQRILVPDEKTAKRLRAILARENLIPKGTDPWQIFDVERWTITDFERNVNLRRAITRSLEQHITALDDVDAASVTIVMPEDKLFAEDRHPVTASIIITPKPGSDITQNRKKIEGIVRLVQYAVEGLKPENITITDQSGLVLNDFSGLADVDRLELAKREMKTTRELEAQYKKSILAALRQIYGEDRVQIINLDITLDTSKKKIDTEEHFPIVINPDNPKTPYDESAMEGSKTLSITLSKEVTEEKFEGTGFNPEGPPGQEGQTPPAYKDLQNMVGRYSKNSVIQNEVVNTRKIQEEKAPWEIRRVTCAVAIDGVWKWKYNDKGEAILRKDGSIEREYVPLTESDIAKAKALIEHAIGYNRERGDSVTVQNVMFDRTAQHQKEDREYRAKLQLQRTILYIMLSVAILLVSFIVFRLISRELERRRRLREEELARQHQAMREAALRAAEEEGAEVEMSVEERARLELQENAINMAREHPEDVAQLIRTWLMEE